MAGYRANIRKIRSKNFLGRSFVISVLINLVFIFIFSHLVSFEILELPEEDLITVTMIELPAIQNPATVRPEIVREDPIAELDVRPRIEPSLPEPAQIQEVETQPEIIEEIEMPDESSPRMEVKIPEIEIPPTVEIAEAPEEVSVRQDVQVASRPINPTISSRREVEGEILEQGELEMQSRLGEESRERIESTYGDIVTPGQISSLPATKEKESPFGNRPLAIMIDNAAPSRPQSGLDRANVVYEVLAEGGITRFMAVYATVEAENVGPVRSARPYFITKAMEHSSIYVHAGESPDAAIFIREERIDDINELIHFQPFWRTRNRTAPHNLYTSTVLLREEAKKLGYVEMINRDAFQFETDRNQVLTGLDVNKIDIQYHPNYTVSYQYVPESQNYIRFMNGQPHVDAVTGRQLEIKNIIIQNSDRKVLDEEGRLAIDFNGEGDGMIIFNGKSEEITWVKNSLNSRTLFYNKDRERLAVHPGNVWIQVIHPDTVVTY